MWHEVTTLILLGVAIAVLGACACAYNMTKRTQHKASSSNETSQIYISWQPPADPNEHILSYNINMKSKLDATSGSIIKACVTAKQFNEDGHRYRLTLPGAYYISVQAVSVYGPGNWTEYK